jgi:hypothetical protein
MLFLCSLLKGSHLWKQPRMGKRKARCLEIFGTKPRSFGDTRKHARTDFLPIVECENEIRPSFSG